MSKLEADVVVIGAGASGISAAVAAAEKEASVIVIEKGSTTGGAANMGMGFFAVESHYAKSQMIDLTVDQAFEFFMEYTHWHPDARLIRRYIAQSADTIDWVEKMGVEFLGVYKYFEKSFPTWHIVKVPGSNKPTERSASVLFKALTDRSAELGVEIMFQTSAKKINTDPSTGRVTGVVIADENGNEQVIECDTVITAAGGFGNNPEMIKEKFGYTWGKDLFSFRIPGDDGDGVNMMWDIGAAESQMNMELTYTTPGITDIFKTLSETMRNPNLMVNLEGKRFMNEEQMQNTTFTGNCITRQTDKIGFTIISDEILDDYRKKGGLDYITFHHNIKNVDKWDSELKTYREGGESETAGLSELHGDDETSQTVFWEADSIEELCEMTGINYKNLSATIAEYNACAGSYDHQFNKHPKLMRAVKGKKFYAAAHRPCGYGTLGGVKVNENLQVLDAANKPIPGLYASGFDGANIFGDSYCFLMPGNTMGWAINSGRIAGYSAVEYLDSDDFVE